MIAPAVALALLLTAGVGTAGASGPTQAAEQSAGTSQSATSDATSTQVNPTNSNIGVRIGSPGDNGSVRQSNSSEAAAAAANAALTGQDVTQSSGGGGVQAASQDAYTDQSADADATSKQVHPTNENIDVRIGSPGGNGDVEQSNSSSAGALAGNLAATGQSAQQQQSGSCCSGSGVQAAEQNAGTKQHADADATSEQIHPTNANTSVRIGSPGDNGKVTQSNDSTALALAGNAAKTIQDVDQKQAGGCGCHGSGVQAAGQWAATHQSSDADAKSLQKGATNSNTPVRIHSPGYDGDVDQSNSSEAIAAAGNLALTKQSVEQQQYGRDGCGCMYDKRPTYKDQRSPCCSTGVQAAGQWAFTGQHADADAESTQYGPTNSSSPVRIYSAGGGGSLSQSNSSFAEALSFNAALTLQHLLQQQ